MSKCLHDLDEVGKGNYLNDNNQNTMLRCRRCGQAFYQ